MTIAQRLTGKSRTVVRLIQQRGIRAVLNVLQDKAKLFWALFRARNQTSVNLDGCTFDLAGVPNTAMKLALINQEYEQFERRAVRYIDPAEPVIELGGCMGVVACITNRALQNKLAHVVVEANPRVVPLLRQSRELNGCQFDIVTAAVAYGSESVTFTPVDDFWGSSLQQHRDREAVTVPAIRLGDIVRDHQFSSFTLVCDIEGHEYDLVKNEPEVVSKAKTIILETHARLIGEQKTEEILSRLSDLGFELLDCDSFVLVLRRGQ